MAIVMLGSCTSAKLVSTWSAPNPGNAMNKVLVISLMGGKYVGIQQQFENDVVKHLGAVGVSAVSGISVFGPKEFQGMTEAEVTSKVNGSGFTGVMLISLLDKSKELVYTPGYTTYEPYPYYPTYWGGMNPYYWRYSHLYDRVYTPGYYSTQTKYVLSAEVFSVADNDKLIYSAQANSIDPNSGTALAESFAKAIVKNLQAKGLAR